MTVFGRPLTPSAAIGALIALICLGSVAFAPWILPADPDVPLGQRWAAPSVGHWLGLDQLGRDMLTRILLAGRVSVGFALMAALLAVFAGAAAGIVSAVFGRWLDLLLSRLADVVASLPVLISTLLVIAGLGSTPIVLVLTIGILIGFSVQRVVRKEIRRIQALDFVGAARLRGESGLWLVGRELLPNAMPVILAEFGRCFGAALMIGAALSFFGLGVQPPAADLGLMVKESMLAIPAGVLAPLYPAAAIALLAFGVNLMAGWLRSSNLRSLGEAA